MSRYKSQYMKEAGTLSQCYEAATSSQSCATTTDDSVVAGLKPRPIRRNLSHHFELQKKTEHEAVVLSKPAGQPHGRRFAAAIEFHDRITRQRNRDMHSKQVGATKDSVAALLNKQPTPTSDALVLGTTAISAGRGALVVLSDGHGSSRLANPETAAKIQHARNLDGHLATGSLACVATENEEHNRQQRSAWSELVTGHEKRLQKVARLADNLVRDFPHGVTNQVHQDVKQQGVMLPRLGFCQAFKPTSDAPYPPMR